MTSIADRIAQSKNRSDRSKALNFTRGDYVIELRELKLVESTQKIGTTYFVLKGKVLEGYGEEALPTGSEPSIRFPLMNESFLSEAKAAIAAILGVDQDDVGGELVTAATADDGAQVRGQRLVMEVDINARGYPVVNYMPESKRPAHWGAAAAE